MLLAPKILDYVLRLGCYILLSFICHCYGCNSLNISHTVHLITLLYYTLDNNHKRTSTYPMGMMGDKTLNMRICHRLKSHSWDCLHTEICFCYHVQTIISIYFLLQYYRTTTPIVQNEMFNVPIVWSNVFRSSGYERLLI